MPAGLATPNMSALAPFSVSMRSLSSVGTVMTPTVGKAAVQAIVREEVQLDAAMFTESFAVPFEFAGDTPATP